MGRGELDDMRHAISRHPRNRSLQPPNQLGARASTHKYRERGEREGDVYHPHNSSLSGSTWSHRWSTMSRAFARFRWSTTSIGSRNAQTASASLSDQRYFSTITRRSGHGFKFRMYRSAPAE